MTMWVLELQRRQPFGGTHFFEIEGLYSSEEAANTAAQDHPDMDHRITPYEEVVY